MATKPQKSPPGKVKTRNPSARKPAKAQRARRGWLRRVFGGFVYWSAVAAVWGVIALGGVAAYYAHDLPDVDAAFAATRQPSVTVLAADGTELATVGEVYGAALGLGELPAHLPQAVMAIEDRRFRDHLGLDPIGLARAMWANVRAGRVVQGGSTLTQQVAKNLFLTPERTIKRKVQELMLALWLESRFTKDEILTVYLNRVYFGTGTYGVDAAARRYFGVSARDLSTYQSALLAGLLKAPSRLNPLTDATAADARARVVLSSMVAAGYLSPADAERARDERRRFTAPARGDGVRYAVDWVLERLSDFVTVDSDIVVRTTLASGLQRRAERLVAEALAGEPVVGQAAVVVMTPSGAVRAMIGGRSYAESQFNRAAQARRQPGSAFKPIVYLAALEAGLGPDAVMTDEPVRIGDWSPKNFGGGYEGAMRLDEALAHSVNTIAVKSARHAGWGRVARAAERLGVSGPLAPHPSLALGSADVTLLDMTGVYAAFANGGHGVWPYAIEEIAERSGAVLYRRRGGGPGRVAESGDVAALTAMLAGAIERGTGRNARLDRPAAGKTGTSQNNRDGWFVGYTADLVAGVWMGNDDGSTAGSLIGGGAPARLWRAVMLAAHAGLPARALYGGPPQEPLFVDERDSRTRAAGEKGGGIGAGLLGWIGGLLGGEG